MARSAYKCTVEMSFINNNKETKIDSNFIKYIMIENLYESRYMPVIYVSVAVTNELYTDILSSEKTGKFLLSIERYNVFSSSALSKRYIQGQFTYILPTSNPNYTEELIEDVSADTSYRVITVGLMSMEIMNKVKSSFNGIYGNIDHNTLILRALEGLDMVVKQPLYNPVFDTIIVPALNSKTKLLQFLYTKCPFYDTNYIFFVDFVKGYLIDLTGTPCPAYDGTLDTVYIDVNEVTSSESYYEGMEIKDGAYYLYLNPASTNVSENKGMDKISNQYVYVDDDGSVRSVDLDINNHQDAEIKQTFKRGGEEDSILEKNIAESNTIVIELVKENIDSNILTPNKEYIINNYADYADYNGKYTLLYKKEVIKNIQGEFGISVCLGLRKVGNITSIGVGVVQSAIKKSKSAVGRYKSTQGAQKDTTSNKNKTSNSGKTPTVIKPNATNKPQPKSVTLPTAKTMRATSDSSIRRTPTTI